ncbi:methionyl-tRNA formyltransferase, mitochondrial [Halyomorpha halys]|uniref:methionyl-tRNA formyltransferase, mitochondrial n=1 Tax=Halyomorpha halys TaxID=286706 RepID=UPI0006D51DAF|nr:methionyl-tRNA formyltransferase, mitochondrial [Halyomorpha halys]
MFSGLMPNLKLCFYFQLKNRTFTKYAPACRKYFISSNVYEPPWRVLFFGTDEFSLESLKLLCAKLRTGTLMKSLGVVTKKESVIAQFGLSESLPIYNWPIDLSEIKSQYDVGMVVSFGNLISKKIIDELPLGCINVHASLLPRWRGAAPIIHALKAGDTETGVTIMRIHPHKFDVGEIVRQYRVPIGCYDTTIDLEKKLAMHGALLLMECLRDLNNCLVHAVPQPENGVTYAPKVVASMAKIDWSTSDAKSVINLYRGLSHLYPPKTSWHGTVVKLKKISLEPVPVDSNTILHRTSDSDNLKTSAVDFLNSPSNSDFNFKKNVPQYLCKDSGKCIYSTGNKILRVVCSDGQSIIVEKLQVGSKVLSAVDFYNGYLSKRKKSEWFLS